ncbi:MAG: flagellar basal body P-ring formation protein FlgA [Kordiimonadaceae bacterium]|nr:flagellar basal body P-ring formation protein FlgA [Kordiimonadaceae bacterium]
MSFGSKNKMSLLKPALLGCVLIVASNAVTAASELRETLSTEAAVIRLNDLFTDVGEAGNEVIMSAPAPGKRKTITSFELNRIANRYKLDWERPAYLKRVEVSRDGTRFNTASLMPAIIEQIRDAGMDADIQIKIHGRKKGFYLPIGYSPEELTFDSFELNGQQTRFSAVILLPTSDTKYEDIRISGVVQEVRLIPMLSRLITPGEVITEDDIQWKKHPSKRINMRTIVSANNLIGQTVRRAMLPGKLLIKNNIVRPIMIAKGSIVSITLRSGALTLRAKGRALTNGGKGDTIRIMNTGSKRTLEATVISPNKVEVHVRPIITLAAR